MHTPRPENLPVHQPLRKQVVGIDALRLLAAVLVMGSHLLVSDWIRSRHGGVMPTTAFVPLRPLFCYGWIGVEIFFVISGFVIAYSAQGVSATKFARHRFFRLWPICVLSAAVALGAATWLGIWSPQVRLQNFLKTILFAPGVPGLEYIDDPFWTLPVEVAFYAVVFALISLRQLRRLPRVAAALALVSTLYWALVLADRYWSGRFWHAVHRGLQVVSPYPSTLIVHGCFFATGVLLWDLLLRPAQTRTRRPQLAALCIAIAGGVMGVWVHATLAADYLEMRFPQWGAVAIWLMAVALIAISVRFNAEIQHRLGVRGMNMMRALGLITYPLYLLHDRLGYALVVGLHGVLGWYGALVLAVALIAVAACFLALVVDPAIQRRLRQRFGN